MSKKVKRSKKNQNEQSHSSIARKISDVVHDLDPKKDQELIASLRAIEMEHASKAVVPGNDLYYHGKS